MRLIIAASLYQRLRGVAGRSGASLFMVLQAALATLLSKLVAGEDIAIGAPIAGRTNPALDGPIRRWTIWWASSSIPWCCGPTCRAIRRWRS